MANYILYYILPASMTLHDARRPKTFLRTSFTRFMHGGRKKKVCAWNNLRKLVLQIPCDCPLLGASTFILRFLVVRPSRNKLFPLPLGFDSWAGMITIASLLA